MRLVVLDVAWHGDIGRGIGGTTSSPSFSSPPKAVGGGTGTAELSSAFPPTHEGVLIQASSGLILELWSNTVIGAPAVLVNACLIDDAES